MERETTSLAPHFEEEVPDRDMLQRALGYPTRGVDAGAAVERIWQLAGRDVGVADRGASRSVVMRAGVFGYAALAAALTIGFFAIKQISDTPKPAPPTKTYSTNPGQRANITLADGSKVTLAPASTVRMSGRSVELQGEAVFTVTHTASVPFTVRTGNASITVLGTRFAVRRYPEDSVTNIAVADGKVSANDTILSSGDMAVVSASSVGVRHNTDINTYFSWTTGQLVFNQTPLAEVLPVLSRWYNVDFVMADPSLATRPLTASLDDNTLTHDILSVITSALNMRYTRVGRTITLYTRSTQ